MKIHKLADLKGEFFRILETTDHSQIGVMTVPPAGDSGLEETHSGDQIVYVIEGRAEIEIENEKRAMDLGEIVVIPAEAKHHIWNRGNTELFFLTMYSPPDYE